ncbi:DUF2569 family protein [Sphingomonas sp. HDW15A]|uniref:DUF2569 family protein n=1 Tax=Sphingomonas sp. HDW15A TaxID=2714942 RepID=UPI001407EC05|nr:DUF2569 family protein [Sphingomonas sp. HDW15A]QIK95320.1 DUF2569 family protein [Sphingomonas sp. HDW15A]
MIKTISLKARGRAIALRQSIEQNLDRIVQSWLVIAGLGSALRIATSPSAPSGSELAIIAPYALLIFAPAFSFWLALRWFANGHEMAQPAVRLARVGRWRDVSAAEAQRHPLFGTDGFMVSLLIGMLLNIPIRAMEYLAATPAMAGSVPAWLTILRTMMTLDVVLMTSLYSVAFVAALRRVPSFPRLLAGIWVLDLALQGLTARMVAAEPGLPEKVAHALQGLLTGNVWKVLISIAIWLPYLLLSKRVNVTFRHRIAD